MFSFLHLLISLIFWCVEISSLFAILCLFLFSQAKYSIISSLLFPLHRSVGVKLLFCYCRYSSIVFYYFPLLFIAYIFFTILLYLLVIVLIYYYITYYNNLLGFFLIVLITSFIYHINFFHQIIVSFPLSRLHSMEARLICCYYYRFLLNIFLG